jgi:hypothetical protein
VLLRPLQPSARVSVYHRLKMAIEGNVRWPTQPTYDRRHESAVSWLGWRPCPRCGDNFGSLLKNFEPHAEALDRMEALAEVNGGARC